MLLYCIVISPTVVEGFRKELIMISTPSHLNYKTVVTDCDWWRIHYRLSTALGAQNTIHIQHWFNHSCVCVCEYMGYLHSLCSWCQDDLNKWPLLLLCCLCWLNRAPLVSVQIGLCTTRRCRRSGSRAQHCACNAEAVGRDTDWSVAIETTLIRC